MNRLPMIEEKVKIITFDAINSIVISTKSKFLSYPVVGLISLLLIIFDVAFKGRSYCSSIKDACKLRKCSALMLAWRMMALPFKDYAVARILLSGHDDIHNWTVNEIPSHKFDELRQSDASFIISNGHFTRQAYYAVVRRDILPQRLMQVTLPPNPDTGHSAYDRRVEMQLGASLSVGKHSRPDDLELAVVGQDTHILRTMIRHLKKSRSVILMNIDAPWDGKKDHCYARPFAGHKEKIFSRGIIELARISGRPIVSSIPIVNNDNSITIQWGDPVYVTDSMSEAEQNDILDRLIDPIEVAVGSRPDQYLLPIGVGRCWDMQTNCWEGSSPSL